MDRNYDKAVELIRRALNSWKYRYLTIFGKITVIKMLENTVDLGFPMLMLSGNL